MSSRDAILAAVRAAARPSSGRPAADGPRSTVADPAAAFAEQLAAAGGACLRVASGADLAEALAELPGFAGAERVLSRLPRVPSRGPAGEPASPRDCARLDAALLAAELAVAENGAVWWVPGDPIERAAGFLAERVAFAVPERALVHDLHEAYARIHPERAAFGCFVSGPSKTADIEQTLVVGAHGPRALAVLLLVDPPGTVGPQGGQV